MKTSENPDLSVISVITRALALDAINQLKN